MANKTEDNNIGAFLALCALAAGWWMLKNVGNNGVAEKKEPVQYPMSRDEISRSIDHTIVFNVKEQAYLQLALKTPSVIKDVKKQALDLILMNKFHWLNDIIISYHDERNIQYSTYTLDNLINKVVVCLCKTKDCFEKYCTPLSIFASMTKFPLKSPLGLTADVILLKMSINAIKKTVLEYYFNILYQVKTEEELLSEFESIYQEIFKGECYEIVDRGISYFC